MKIQSISVAQARLITEEKNLILSLDQGHLSLQLGEGVFLTATKEGLVLTGEDSQVDLLWGYLENIHWVEAREQDGQEFMVIYDPNGEYLDTVEDTTQITEVLGEKPYRILYK